MKTIKRLMARATTAAFLMSAFFAPIANAQFANASADYSAFEAAVIALADTKSAHTTSAHISPLQELASTAATADIAEAALGDRAQAPIMSNLDWRNYGRHLSDALRGDHAGLRHSALRLVIAYSDQLEMGNETVVDLMKIYREDDSEQARRMAVVALAELDSGLAVDYLERSHDFEKSESVKRTIAAVVAAHRAI